MSLYQDYRPTSLKHFHGNEDLKRDLRPFIKGNRKPPKAILFTGPSGCGKTTLARILAKSMGCAEQDIQELDTADFRGIDSIREIRRQMGLASLSGSDRVWILDECHKLTNDAQNALLKALENPPAHVYFILCTTDPQLLLKTILTRCTQFVVEALTTSDLVDVMKRACDGEKVDVPDAVLKKIAKTASGSPRAALSTLERVIARDPDEYEEELASFANFETQIKDLCQTLMAGKVKWKEVADMIKGLKDEPETIRRAILGYMNAVLLSGKDAPRAAYIMDCFKEPFFNTGPAGLTLSCYAAMLKD